MGSSRKACVRAGALPSDRFAQLPITPLANFDRPGEIGTIAQTPPQPHIGCIAVALSHLHGSEEVVVAIIDRRKSRSSRRRTSRDAHKPPPGYGLTWSGGIRGDICWAPDHRAQPINHTFSASCADKVGRILCAKFGLLSGRYGCGPFRSTWPARRTPLRLQRRRG
jgi:hypothetical protein